MVVIDGIVMGPTHCAYQNCSEKLANARTGVFCLMHESQHEGRCRIKTCYNAKEPNSQACVNHRQRWYDHVIRFGRQSVLGVRRIIRRTEEEGGPAWLRQLRRRNNPPHDQPNNETQEPDNYFTAPRFYCVETICAPCGVVIAWTKFVKSEGAAQIMDFLEDVYPTQESRPSYVCIDKACVVLKYLINSHNWNIWKTSTRFVVDSYHYINHRVTDYLCRIYCNPSPLNGSAPNLVVVERDVHGNQHYKRAFNTQACEQLNAWLGGFQSILNRMTVDNFNWTLHALLFIHTQRVIQKQYKRLNQNMQTQLPGQQINEDEVEANGVEIDRVD
ncbi:hypothetical protein BDQ17DRAFT_1257340 [Cyathus striatus]|nr:hypothetical protein BDQ17DRAFT_1257340 [Cyathus striatus]